MTVEIVSPDKELFKGEAEYVKLPGTQGSFGVLKNHAATISTLEKGVLKIVGEDKQETTFDVNGGVVEVFNNKIIVLVD